MELKPLNNFFYYNPLFKKKEIKIIYPNVNDDNKKFSQMIKNENNISKLQFIPPSSKCSSERKELYLSEEDNKNDYIDLYKNYITDYTKNNIYKIKKIKLNHLKKRIHLDVKNENYNKKNIDANSNNDHSVKNKFKINNAFRINKYLLNRTIRSKLKSDKKIKKEEGLAHSLSIDNFLEINNKSISGSLENSKIFDDNFIDGIRNENRKNNLLKIIEKYKKFKSMKRLNMTTPLNNSFSLLDNDEGHKRKNSDRINEYNKKYKNIIEKEINWGSEGQKKHSKTLSADRIQLKNLIYMYNNLQSNDEKDSEKNIKYFLDYFNKNKKNLKNNINLKNNNSVKSNKVLVRRILREEHYIIDESGNEKILEVNQSLLPGIINTNKLESSRELNLYKKNKSLNIDDEIIKRERYKQNNRKIEIPIKKILKKNNENSFIGYRGINPLLDISSNNKNNINKTINGHIIDLLKIKEKPIIIRNKIEKKKILNNNEYIKGNSLLKEKLPCNQLFNNNGKIQEYDNKQKYKNNEFKNNEINLLNNKKESNIFFINKIKEINNNFNNEYNLKNYNSSRELNNIHKKYFVLNEYSINKSNNSYKDLHKIYLKKNIKINLSDKYKNKFIKNYSINEIFDKKNKKNIYIKNNKNKFSLKPNRIIEKDIKIKTNNSNSLIENNPQIINYDNKMQIQYNKYKNDLNKKAIEILNIN